MDRRVKPGDDDLQILFPALFTIRLSFLPHHSLASFHVRFSPAPMSGVRSAVGASDACEGTRIKHAMTGVRTPHRTTGPSKCPPCVRCAPQGARGRVRYPARRASKPDVLLAAYRASPTCGAVRRL